MTPVPSSSSGGGTGCLQGRVFGLTGELPRKEVQATLKAHGATVSAIIHKRVSYVLCTTDAVKYNTQKVRKALKHGIPLVSEDFVAACALARGVVDPAPFRITTTATAATARSTPAASPALGSLADTGLGRPASAAAAAAASAAVLKGVRKPASAREDDVDAKIGVSKSKRQKKRRKSVDFSPGDGSTGVQGDGSGGGGGGDDGCVSTVLAASEDTKKKRGGQKKKKRRSEGKDPGGAVVADSCTDAEGASQDGIERSQKKSKKKRKSEANARKNAVQAAAAAAAGGGGGGGNKGQKGVGTDSSGAGDAQSAHAGDTKKEKRDRKKTQKK